MNGVAEQQSGQPFFCYLSDTASLLVDEFTKILIGQPRLSQNGTHCPLC